VAPTRHKAHEGKRFQDDPACSDSARKPTGPLRVGVGRGDERSQLRQHVPRGRPWPTSSGIGHPFRQSFGACGRRRWRKEPDPPLSVALLDERANIVTSGPTVAAYEREALKQEAVAPQVPLRTDGASNLLAMLSAINNKTRLVYIRNPNDPTGAIVGRDDLLRFVEVVPESIWIVVDEASMEYIREGHFPDTIKEIEFRRPNLVTLRPFSRAYGMAGLRIGYIAGPPGPISAIQKLQSTDRISSVAQAAAKASQQDRDELERRVELNRRSLFDLQHGLDALGLDYYRPHANFVEIQEPRPYGLRQKAAVPRRACAALCR